MTTTPKPKPNHNSWIFRPKPPKPKREYTPQSRPIFDKGDWSDKPRPAPKRGDAIERAELYAKPSASLPLNHGLHQSLCQWGTNQLRKPN
jgi:hypothetical protein